ncbi:MAG: MraY family glycosyltransferase [Spirochaetaceae bacterium]
MISVLAIGLPFLINILIIPFLIFLAHRYAWYDHSNHRKIHTGEMPRIGGIGIFLSFFLGGVLLFILHESELGFAFHWLKDFSPLILAVFAVHLVGLLDDFTNLRARHKLWIQIAVALFIVSTKNYSSFTFLTFAETSFPGPIIGFIVSFIWIVGVTNSINLIDGMDGLAGGVTCLAFFFMGLTALYLENTTGTLLSFLLFGSVVGFLFFNLPRAKIFMGDSGSLFLGIMAALLPFYSLSDNLQGPIKILMAASFLIIPIMDTLIAVIRRTKRKKPFYTPDQEHLHHKLLYCGFKTRHILFIMYGITTAASGGVYWWVTHPSRSALLFILLVWIASAVFFYVMNRKFRAAQAAHTAQEQV